MVDLWGSQGILGSLEKGWRLKGGLGVLGSNGWVTGGVWWRVWDAGGDVWGDPGVSSSGFTLPVFPPGTNMLLVGVHGPKAPCEEVHVKHEGNRVYTVTYSVRERGEYVLLLRWGDRDVPGSPFRVTAA